jgi:hypothetical protein
MNRIIEKIFFLQNEKIRRWGKIEGYGFIIIGIANISTCPLINHYFKNLYLKGFNKLVEKILEFSKDSSLTIHQTNQFEKIAGIISDASIHYADLFGAIGYLFVALGIAFIVTGLCQLKCYELICTENKHSIENDEIP